MESTEQDRLRELANSSSIHRSIYSEIEEVGWEHLVTLAGDLTFLSFRVRDKRGRVHILQVQLDSKYPKVPPSISADLPYILNVKWSKKSRLKDLVEQFHEHLERLEEFWSTLEDIENSLCIVDPKPQSRATSFRHISIGSDCTIMIFLNAKDPRSLPGCRFLGSDPKVNSLRESWLRNSSQWNMNKTLCENLTSILEAELPKARDVQMSDQQMECGICYAQRLPINEELGPNSGTEADYTCDNINCNRAFHSICLADWLRSITTTRQSYNVLFGNCPYCSEAVAVKINESKK